MLILLGWSTRLRRVLPYECFKCSWRQEYGGSCLAGITGAAVHGDEATRG